MSFSVSSQVKSLEVAWTFPGCGLEIFSKQCTLPCCSIYQIFPGFSMEFSGLLFGMNLNIHAISRISVYSWKKISIALNLRAESLHRPFELSLPCAIGLLYTPLMFLMILFFLKGRIAQDVWTPALSPITPSGPLIYRKTYFPFYVYSNLPRYRIIHMFILISILLMTKFVISL